MAKLKGKIVEHFFSPLNNITDITSIRPASFLENFMVSLINVNEEILMLSTITQQCSVD